MPYRKHEHPTVTSTTIAKKIAEGFASEGWSIVETEAGKGGSQIMALMPLLRYLVKRGIRVHESEGFALRGSHLIERMKQ